MFTFYAATAQGNLIYLSLVKCLRVTHKKGVHIHNPPLSLLL